MANKPNNPSLWSKAKSLAKSKFDVYPSAYANGWAAKYYKSKGGTWRKGEKGMMMEQGGMTPANKAAMKLAKNMKGKVVGSDRMLKHGGFHSKPKMQNGSIISDKTVNPNKDYTFKYSLSKEEYDKIPTASERFRSDVGKGTYDVYSKTGKYQPMSTAKKIVTSGEGTGIGRFGRIKLASGETGETRRNIRKELRSTGNRPKISEAFNGCFPGAKPGSCRPQNIKGGSVGGSGFKVGGYHSKLKQSYLNKYK